MAFYKSGRSRSGYTPNTQMNITALVDVTLVTLIIYILVSPALEHGIDVQLPQATPHRMVTKEPAVVSMSKKGRLFRKHRWSSAPTRAFPMEILSRSSMRSAERD